MNQTAFINQKLMNPDYQMRKFYQVKREINMISLFEHYKDVIPTPKERLIIEPSKVPSKIGVRKIESSKVPSIVGVGKRNPIILIM